MTANRGPVPTLTQTHCQSCPALLSQSQVAHGMRRCKACRQTDVRWKAPKKAEPARKVEGEKAPTSWWIDAPRNITALAQTHVPRMRYGTKFWTREPE